MYDDKHNTLEKTAGTANVRQACGMRYQQWVHRNV